jgi:hypothetical protein
MQLENKYVFVDLDETLIHTNVYKEEATLDRELQINIGNNKHAEIYVSQLRVGAHKLLEELRQTVGNDRVFMLTVSMWDYASRNNNMHKLGFPESQIYSREHIRRRVAILKMEEVTENSQAYLIDNLSAFELGDKFSLISRELGFSSKNIHLFKISSYYGDIDGSDDISETERNHIMTLIREK